MYVIIGVNVIKVIAKDDDEVTYSIKGTQNINSSDRLKYTCIGLYPFQYSTLSKCKTCL